MTQGQVQQVNLNDEELNSQIESIAKTGKKTKVAIYLTDEAEKAFAELYITRYRKDRKVDRSTIACEAILALFEKELVESRVKFNKRHKSSIGTSSFKT